MKYGILNPVTDEVLIAGLSKYARNAGIGGNTEYITTSAFDYKPTFTKKDAKMLKNIFMMQREGTFGVVYRGYDPALLCKKFMICTGAMCRAYKSVLYSPMQMYVTRLSEGEDVERRVTFIPDFVSAEQDAVPSWKREMILGHLMQKQADNQPMVLGVWDDASLKKAYGRAMFDFIAGSYVGVGI